VQQGRTYQSIPGSDSYTVYTNNTRDVDEYNRRGSYSAVETTSSVDSLAMNDFKYTRKIEKFYNPEVVVGSGDEELMYYYANSEAQSTPTQINIYVDSPDYWNPYFYSSAWAWAWNRPAYMNPWYYNNPWLWDAWTWGPSFGWNWGFGPSWTWGPSFGWNWGWCPGWAHGPGWGPSFGWHNPVRPAGPGASRPVRNPNIGGRTSLPGNPVRTGRFSGGNAHANPNHVISGRPGRTSSSAVSTTGRPSNSNVSGTTSGRPSAGSVARPYNPTNANRPTGTYSPVQNPNRVNATRNQSTQHNNYNSNPNNAYRRSSSSSSSQGSYRSSGSSFGGRSSGGGFSSGGGRSGGGASGRH
ncbi:MAG: hypothetical protein K2M65_07410, partial [Muribaculaceae bacterium]|nr:hypothetical protein [Muribaculaceae bacterium]